MKFKVNSIDLTRSLKRVLKGFDKEETSKVILEVTENGVKFTVVGLTAYFQSEIPTISVEGAIGTAYALHGLTLGQLADIFPQTATEITFNWDSNSRVFKVSYVGHSFKLPTKGEVEPELTPKYRELGYVQGHEFIKSLTDLTKVVSKESSDGPFHCVHVTLKDETVSFFGSDQFVLSEITHEYSKIADEEYTALLTPSQANLLNKSCLPDETLKLVVTNDKFGYIDNDNLLSLVGFLSLPPVGYHEILNFEPSPRSFTLSKKALSQVVSTVSRLSFDDKSIVFELTPGQDTVLIRNTSGDSIDLNLQELNIVEPITLYFSKDIILNSLVPISEDTVEFAIGNDLEQPDTYQVKLQTLSASGELIENVKVSAMAAIA